MNIKKTDNQFLTLGAETLSNKELLTLIVREESTQYVSKVLEKYPNIDDLFTSATYEEIREAGVSHSKAISILATVEFAKRNKPNNQVSEAITSEDSALNLLKHIGEFEHEEMWVIYMNRGNKPLRTEQHSKGGLTGTVVDVRLILKRALQLNATGMILGHNHPSGNPRPSEADIKNTKKLKRAADTMDINLFDHFIITRESHTSLVGSGLI